MKTVEHNVYAAGQSCPVGSVKVEDMPLQAVKNYTNQAPVVHALHYVNKDGWPYRFVIESAVFAEEKTVHICYTWFKHFPDVMHFLSSYVFNQGKY